MEFLKNYDCTISYHSGKANVVADALSQKSRGSLACHRVVVTDLIQSFSELDLEEQRQTEQGNLVTIVAQSSIRTRIREAQLLEPYRAQHEAELIRIIRRRMLEAQDWQKRVMLTDVGDS